MVQKWLQSSGHKQAALRTPPQTGIICQGKHVTHKTTRKRCTPVMQANITIMQPLEAVQCKPSKTKRCAEVPCRCSQKRTLLLTERLVPSRGAAEACHACSAIACTCTCHVWKVQTAAVQGRLIERELLRDKGPTAWQHLAKRCCNCSAGNQKRPWPKCSDQSMQQCCLHMCSNCCSLCIPGLPILQRPLLPGRGTQTPTTAPGSATSPPHLAAQVLCSQQQLPEYAHMALCMLQTTQGTQRPANRHHSVDALQHVIHQQLQRARGRARRQPLQRAARQVALLPRQPPRSLQAPCAPHQV